MNAIIMYTLATLLMLCVMISGMLLQKRYELGGSPVVALVECAILVAASVMMLVELIKRK